MYHLSVSLQQRAVRSWITWQDQYCQSTDPHKLSGLRNYYKIGAYLSSDKTAWTNSSTILAFFKFWLVEFLFLFTLNSSYLMLYAICTYFFLSCNSNICNNLDWSDGLIISSWASIVSPLSHSSPTPPHWSLTPWEIQSNANYDKTFPGFL